MVAQRFGRIPQRENPLQLFTRCRQLAAALTEQLDDRALLDVNEPNFAFMLDDKQTADTVRLSANVAWIGKIPLDGSQAALAEELRGVAERILAAADRLEGGAA